MAKYMSVHDIKYHIVGITKYRYKILTGKIAQGVRELLIQGYRARGITIIEDSVGKDHIHMPISVPTNIAPSKIVQYQKGHSSKLLQDEFRDLGKRYWGHIYGLEDIFVQL